VENAENTGCVRRRRKLEDELEVEKEKKTIN